MVTTRRTPDRRRIVGNKSKQSPCRVRGHSLISTVPFLIATVFFLFIWANVVQLHERHTKAIQNIPEEQVRDHFLRRDQQLGGFKSQQQAVNLLQQEQAAENQLKKDDDDALFGDENKKDTENNELKDGFLPHLNPKLDDDPPPENEKIEQAQGGDDDANQDDAISNSNQAVPQPIMAPKEQNKTIKQQENGKQHPVADDVLFGDDEKPEDTKHDGFLPHLNVATDDENGGVDGNQEDDNDDDGANQFAKKIVKRRLESVSPEMPLSCDGLARKLPNILIDGNVIKMRTSVSSSKRWGNALSSYWAARAMAILGGYSFQGATGPAPFWHGDQESVVYHSSWMEFLPKQVPAPQYPQPELFARACSCVSEHFHGCVAGWGAIRDDVIKGTRAAMESYVESQPPSLRPSSLQFEPTDWVVYERCCIFCHKNHGFSNILAYDVLPKDGSYTIYTLSPPDVDEADGHGLCGPLQELRNAYIRQRNPDVKIVPLTDGSLFQDFGNIVYAPNLLIPSTGTSFGLWAALANTGNVHIGKPNHSDNLDHYPTDLHILNVPFLDGLHAREELGLNDTGVSERERVATVDKLRNSQEGVKLIKAWFIAELSWTVLRELR
eukprot:scaffold223_cov145-Amphora_coffeaeformis.AAC.4